MSKIVNICVALAGVSLGSRWLHYFIIREPMPQWIPTLLLLSIAWFAWQFYKRSRPKQPQPLNDGELYEFPPMDAPNDVPLDEIFNAVFGFANKDDFPAWIKISKSEARQGCVKPVSYKIRKPCETCDGTGIGSDGNAEPCTKCEGKGINTAQERTVLGVMTYTATCKKCNGKGIITKDLCWRCNGKGFNEAPEQHDVSIPENFTNHSITVPDKGHYIDKHKRGRLIVTVAHKNK